MSIQPTEDQPLDQDQYDDLEFIRQYRARQQSRSKVMAFILAGLCVLFFMITIAKMGLS